MFVACCSLLLLRKVEDELFNLQIAIGIFPVVSTSTRKWKRNFPTCKFEIKVFLWCLLHQESRWWPFQLSTCNKGYPIVFDNVKTFFNPSYIKIYIPAGLLLESTFWRNFEYFLNISWSVAHLNFDDWFPSWSLCFIPFFVLAICSIYVMDQFFHLLMDRTNICFTPRG